MSSSAPAKMGHFFPGGTVDAFDCWLELSATDDKGRVDFLERPRSRRRQRPRRSRRAFLSLASDRFALPTPSTSATPGRPAPPSTSTLIPPGAADTAHFRLQIPPDAGDRIHVVAKLNYRKFSWYNTQFSFAAARIPRSRIRAISARLRRPPLALHRRPDESARRRQGHSRLCRSSSLRRTRLTSACFLRNLRSRHPKSQLNPDDWTRWNDYGIGLFLQGDLTGAAAAFSKITEIDPKNPDGWINIGRVRVQEGNICRRRTRFSNARSLSIPISRVHIISTPACCAAKASMTKPPSICVGC